jgi:hypothetical protein
MANIELGEIRGKPKYSSDGKLNRLMKKRKTKPITTKAAILLALPDGSINGTRTYRSNKIAKNENPAKENPICNRFIPGKLAAPTDNERLHIYPQQNKKPKSAN